MYSIGQLNFGHGSDDFGHESVQFRPRVRITSATGQHNFLLSSAMKSCDWAVCHWCEYWVSQPYMHGFEDDN